MSRCLDRRAPLTPGPFVPGADHPFQRSSPPTRPHPEEGRKAPSRRTGGTLPDQAGNLFQNPHRCGFHQGKGGPAVVRGLRQGRHMHEDAGNAGADGVPQRRVAEIGAGRPRRVLPERLRTGQLRRAPRPAGLSAGRLRPRPPGVPAGRFHPRRPGGLVRPC